MKKALLLGVMALFAFNIANAQNVKEQKSVDQQKMEKEKYQISTANTTAPTNTMKRTDGKDAASVSDPKLSAQESSTTTKINTVEKTNKNQTPKTLKASEMSRTDKASIGTKKGSALKPITNDPTSKKTAAPTVIKRPKKQDEVKQDAKANEKPVIK